jgi:uncharacterized protein (TIGR03437 family)
MSLFRSTLLSLVLSWTTASAAALVPVPTHQQPSLPATGLEPNRGQAKAGILFLSPGSASIAVTAQSVLYSPIYAELALVASNSNSVVSFSNPLPGVVNSYSGADPTKWVKGIPRYAVASLAAVYPGIDAQYAVDANGILTLNMILAAGIDPNTIVFQIAQAVSLTADSAGTLFANFGTDPHLPPVYLSFPMPVAFQTAGTVQTSRSVSYAIQSTTQFGLVVQGQDMTAPLHIALQLSGVIDGANSGTSGIQSAFDAAGNTFFAATIPDAAGKAGPFPTSTADGCGLGIGVPIACSDVAVYKYSSAGTLAFITYLAGRTRESAGFVGIAPDGTLAVAGTTDSSDFPITATALQSTYAGPQARLGSDFGTGISGDFFAAKLDPTTGTLESSTFLGGPNGDTMGTAALGADGSIYFLPVFIGGISAGMPTTSGALLTACQSDPCLNGYVARLSPSLDRLIYGTYLPGVSQATARLYSDGSVYYAGTAGPGFPVTPAAYQQQNAGGFDGIVARLDPSGSTLIFATYLGGPNTDWIFPIAVAPDGSVWAELTSFVECCVNIQFQLVHLDASGSRLLVQEPIGVDDMVVGAGGNLFALASGNITSSPGAIVANSCGSDSYLELSPNGAELFATYLPGGHFTFDGVDAQGTPILLTPNGPAEVVENQSMGPFAGCMVDAASFENEDVTSPGAIVTIFGSQLGPTQGVGFQLVNGLVPTSLGGAQVLVNGEPVPILYASYGQLNVILPYSLAVGKFPTIQVLSEQTPANVLTTSVVQTQGITLFQTNGAAAAVNQDGTVNSPQNPAQPGSIVSLYGTGGGQTMPISVVGEVTPPTLWPLAHTPVIILGDGSIVTVEWSGAAPDLVSGVTQINIRLPDVIPVVNGYPKGTLPLDIMNETSFHSAVVTISVMIN